MCDDSTAVIRIYRKGSFPIPSSSLTWAKHHDRRLHFQYIQIDSHRPNKKSHYYVPNHIGHIQNTSLFSNIVYISMCSICHQ